MREHPEPRPRDDKDAAQGIARDLAEIASHIGQLYDALKVRFSATVSQGEPEVEMGLV